MTMPKPITPRPTAEPTATAPPKALSFAPRAARPVVLRIFLYAVEGWGKTTLGAHAPKPFIVMPKGENGYLTLLDFGRVPALPAADCGSWEELLATLTAFLANPGDRQTLVLDGLGAAERLCHESVVQKQFKGEWGDEGFMAYGKGPEVALTPWLSMLHLLERIHAAGINVVVLGHSRVKPYQNPAGPNFDRFIPDCHDKTWSATARQFDNVLFGGFKTIVTGAKDVTKKGKGIGGTSRVLWGEQRDSHVAKNRCGLPEVLEMGGEYSESWNELWAAITAGKVNANV